MKKTLLFACLMLTVLFGVSQTKVTFTGAMLDGSYCPFEAVKVTNITKGWTETLVYPDTVLILSGLGVEEASSSREGIMHVYPNPFEDFTDVEFDVLESGPVDIRVVGVDGVQKTSWEGYLPSGTHQVRITLESPQMALVVVATERGNYVGKLLHVGNGGLNEIDVRSASPRVSERSHGSNRSGGDFTPGDMMSYEGMLRQCADSIYSDKVTQPQYVDEQITLAFPVSGIGGEVQNLPYYQSFENDFGTYLTFDEIGPQSWKIDYNTAHMTGYANSTNYANEDWLISSPVNLTNVTDAKMTISYICRYFHSITEDITIWASTDYNWCDNPMNATWTQLPAFLTEGDNWLDFMTTEIALTEFVGQIVTVAVKYTSSDNKAGTIEIQSILIEEGTAGGGPTPPGPRVEVQALPYHQSFTSEFGTYMTYDVLGLQSWEIDYSTAKMTGYVGGSYFANEDWLISSPVAITDVSDAKMTMNYIGRYFNNINDDVTIWASTNYTWGDNPTEAAWTHVPASLTEGSNWNNFMTTEIALTDYVGQTVTFAVKYTSTDTKAGTLEIQSITIEEGSGVTPPTPGEGEGSGTFEDPYNVAAGIELQNEQPIAWVHGYIVGAVKSGLTSVSSNADINWSAPFDLATNVLIADDAACHEISQCIIVNLPAGKPLRTMVNLVDHPENLGKQLSVLGKLRTYFGQAGLRDSNGTEADFVLEGGVIPPTPGTEIFSETFASGQGVFTIQDVVLPSELTYVWQPLPSYSCMKASAYVGQAFNAESWLVSPAIDLSGVSDATLTFEQAVNYATLQGALAMMISTNYNGDVTTATWNELNLDQWPAGNNWTFITSSADLSSYVGQQVTIAFKYTSSTSASPTWEVKNFVVE